MCMRELGRAVGRCVTLSGANGTILDMAPFTSFRVTTGVFRVTTGVFRVTTGAQHSVWEIG
jgi:hypothetical protein